MNKAFVDTTILTDILLKPGSTLAIQARAALARYSDSQLPIYAIKEFKAGPLRHFVWFHNKLVTTKSFARSIEVLQRTSLTPKRYTVSTALEAIRFGAHLTRKLSTTELVDRYGPTASFDGVQCDVYRLAIRTAIEKAWRRRRHVTTTVVQPLSCYREVAPFEEDGVLKLDPTACTVDPECCLAPEMKARKRDLEKLVAALDSEPKKTENIRRRKVLKEMGRIPKHYLVKDKECRHLGDAMFALFAPVDTVVLTTNARDHGPLARALGKTVEAP